MNYLHFKNNRHSGGGVIHQSSRSRERMAEGDKDPHVVYQIQSIISD